MSWNERLHCLATEKYALLNGSLIKQTTPTRLSGRFFKLPGNRQLIALSQRRSERNGSYFSPSFTHTLHYASFIHRRDERFTVQSRWFLRLCSGPESHDHRSRELWYQYQCKRDLPFAFQEEREICSLESSCGQPTCIDRIRRRSTDFHLERSELHLGNVRPRVSSAERRGSIGRWWFRSIWIQWFTVGIPRRTTRSNWPKTIFDHFSLSFASLRRQCPRSTLGQLQAMLCTWSARRFHPDARHRTRRIIPNS